MLMAPPNAPSLHSMVPYAPVWVHLFVYVVTCLAAAMQGRISAALPLLRKVAGRSDHAVPVLVPLLFL
jgi:hypothetical protein